MSYTSQYKPVSPFSTTPTSPFIQGTSYAQRNQQYTDTCKSRWERHSVSAARKAAQLRRDREAQLRTIAKLELLSE